MALVFEFIGAVAAGVLVGYAADGYFGTEPAFLIGTTVLAVIAGFMRLVQVLQRLEQRRRKQG
jgi:F0F1-type ATP synthase assembly protein I